MVIVEHSSLFSWIPSFGEWQSGPLWIRVVRDFDSDEVWEQIERSMRHQERNIRYLRSHGYTYRVSHDEADFDRFYDQMYVPYITARHQGQAIVSEQAYLRSFFQRGMLIIALSKGERAVAALICILCDDVLYASSVGVLDGDIRWVRDGAISALYYYTAQWAYENGIRRIDWGRCRPFITDGIFSHKQRWGFRPERDLWAPSKWLFWIPNGSPVAQAWLRAHPFVPSVGQSGGSPLHSANEPVSD